nr:EOG090X00I4 [Scapholeberis mucronata]
MSQYMSLKNIRLFLKACRAFDLQESDLFEPSMLFDYTDFGKVLKTLSKLSKCPKVARLGVEGFPASDGHNSIEEDEIYKKLEDIENQSESQFQDFNYDAPVSENIYEELCSVGENKTPMQYLSQHVPMDQREYSIRELVESEKRYIEALGMIKSNFIRPLSAVLRDDEKKCIFLGIEKLHEIHTGLHSDLIKACVYNEQKLHSVFLNWKKKLLIYGSVCSNLPSARRSVKAAICRSKYVSDEIERCEREASEGSLNLEDLITLPMQRLLKYPLLLGNLCKHTDKSHEDYQGLQLAYEAMVDVADYTNESTRDYEMRQIINDVQTRISDWNNMEHCDLVEYGRLIKDGELKLRSHEESRATKTRYVFLFDRGVIFCKATRGDQYSFKLFLPLDKFKLEHHPAPRHQNTKEVRWNHQWLLVDNQNKTAYTLYAKTNEAKNKWIRAFSDTLFAGEMTRPAAEAVLRNAPLGTFLLRFKSDDSTLALSLKTGDEIKHMKVVSTSDSSGRKIQYFLSESFPFCSIVELINRYECNSLRESFKGTTSKSSEDMFKFFWGKGSHQSAERLKIQKELFQFQKTVQHGFPSKPISLAWDPLLRLLCIGTKTGAIKVFGAPGVEYYGQLSKDKTLSRLHFVPGHGRVIAVCEDNSLQLWEITSENNSTLACVHSQSLEGKLKKISACCVESNGENLLVGTENGNIYVMDLVKLEMTDTVIYLDVVMQNVTEDFKVNPGAVECISEQPNNPDHILIGYTRGLLVLWNRKTLSADQTFVASQQLESVSWYPSGQRFVSAHNDGSYMKWTIDQKVPETLSKKEPNIVSHYGPSACKAITKILWNQSNAEDDNGVFVFSGGMPRSSYGDRFTVSVVKGEEKHVTFDFTSKVVDFCVINESKSNHAEALVVLAEEELIVIDLISSTWPTYSLPYLASLHCSAITAQTAVAVSTNLYQKIKSFPQGTTSTKMSTRPWPINGGVSLSGDIDPNTPKMLLLTGHEDGSVRFWDASTASLFLLSKFSTSSFFSSDDIDDNPNEDQQVEEEDEWPPFRKVGVFDPYSDDPRLAVKKLSLCPQTGLLTVAGTAGQVVIAEFSVSSVEKEIPVVLVNIVSDRDNFVWKGHDKLSVRKGPLTFKEGFQPTSVLQLHPPAAATSLALHPEWSVLVVGTAHGLTLYDIILKKEIVSKCTLNPNDMSGTGDQPMSRRKSFKKSLRESFRRLRKGRSQRPSTATKTPPTSPASKVDDHNNTSVGPAIPAEIRPVERQIEARNVDDGMGSMVRCLLMAKTYVISQSSISTATVWAGTNNGTIYVFTLNVPVAKRRQVEPVGAQLAKEIQLKHRAPVVSINIIDASFAGIDEINGNPEVTTHESLPPHRVVISSEEQFKVFTLPNLRPYGKYKLTAYTGCKVRRVAIIPFISRSDSSYKENCLVCLSNQGDFHILSLPDLRRQMNAQAIKKEDIHATSTVVLTHQGEAFYMLSSSELQRVALSARNCLQIKCQVAGLKKALDSSAPVDQEIKIAGSDDSKNSLTIANQLSDLSIISNAVIVHEDRENEKNISSEINNSTIVSVEPETSFGDMTVDSVKDHIVVSFDDYRSTEAAVDSGNGNSSVNVPSPTQLEEISDNSQGGAAKETTYTEKMTTEETKVIVSVETETKTIETVVEYTTTSTSINVESPIDESVTEA